MTNYQNQNQHYLSYDYMFIQQFPTGILTKQYNLLIFDNAVRYRCLTLTYVLKSCQSATFPEYEYGNFYSGSGMILAVTFTFMQINNQPFTCSNTLKYHVYTSICSKLSSQFYNQQLSCQTLSLNIFFSISTYWCIDISHAETVLNYKLDDRLSSFRRQTTRSQNS